MLSNGKSCYRMLPILDNVKICWQMFTNVKRGRSFSSWQVLLGSHFFNLDSILKILFAYEYWNMRPQILLLPCLFEVAIILRSSSFWGCLHFEVIFILRSSTWSVSHQMWVLKNLLRTYIHTYKQSDSYSEVLFGPYFPFSFVHFHWFTEVSLTVIFVNWRGEHQRSLDHSGRLVYINYHLIYSFLLLLNHYV